MNIRQSGINAFLRCRSLWDYTDGYRRDLVPKAMVPALFLGSGIHKALELFYREEADPRETFQRWVADEIVLETAQGAQIDASKCMDMAVLGTKMLDGYLEHYGYTPADDIDGIRVLETEIEFDVPIPNTTDGHFQGRIDGILRDKDKLLWILEHKTYSQAQKNHNLNLQTLTYTWALNQVVRMGKLSHLGIQSTERVYGALYNGLRKQAPGPRVTQPLFSREWVMRNRHELTYVERMLPSIHAEMSNPAIRIYPTMTSDCSWCSYMGPCMASQNGADEAWMLENLYMKRPADQ